MADHQTIAVTERIFHLLRRDLDLQPLATVSDRKPQNCVVLWCPTRPEGQSSVVVPHSAEPVREHHPGTAHGGDMAAVLHVTAYIGKVHEERCHAIPRGLLHISDLRGDDRFD